jgi:hypothetical protein
MKAMNALVAKEIRLLLPAYAAALVLAVLPVWFLPSYRSADPTFYILCAFWFGIVMLALSSFGREFGMKTFPLLLAQPLERRRVWWTKTAVLAGAITTVFLAWAISCAPRISRDWGTGTWSEAMAAGGLAAAALVAGGLCMTLLLRQVAAAFWFTILVPWAIVVVGGAWGIPDWVGYLALVAYTVAAFVWARWQFLNAQEVGWTGGTIALPGWRAGDATQSGNRSRRPLAALFWKEIQLHQIGLAGMAGLFGLHLGVVVVRKYAGHAVGPGLRAILDVFAGAWFLVPLLVAAPSVAEERKLGTMQAHLSLPVSRKVQFIVKLFTVLLISGLLSAVLLWTAEGIGSVLKAGSLLEALRTGFNPATLGELCFIFLAWSLICFYASTLASGVIQSFAASVLTAAALWSVAILIGRLAPIFEQCFGFGLFSGYSVLHIALPVLVVAFLYLSYRNFQSASESWQLWRRNLISFAAVFLGVGIVMSAIYDRIWELAMPIEPPRGAARIADGGGPTLINVTRIGTGIAPVAIEGHPATNKLSPGEPLSIFGWKRNLSLLLPDGRIWAGCDVEFFGLQVSTNLLAGRFFPGSNWIDAASVLRGTAGVRGDGTLWFSRELQMDYVIKDGHPMLQPVVDSYGIPALKQLGDGTNWRKAVVDSPNSDAVLLLRRDGSLWQCDSLNNDNANFFRAKAVGSDSNWANIVGGFNDGVVSGNVVYARKKNGEAWLIYCPLARLTGVVMRPELVRLPFLDNLKLKSVVSCWPYAAGIGDDGTLWAWVGSGPLTRDEDPNRERPMRVGSDANWTAAMGDQGRLVARKADGSLWEWRWGVWVRNENPHSMSSADWMKRKPVRLGKASDWLAVGDALLSATSVAADGSLWTWPERSPDRAYLVPSVMGPSRKPRELGNIFDAKN